MNTQSKSSVTVERSDTMKEKLKDFLELLEIILSMVLGFMALSLAFRELFSTIGG